MIGHDRPAHPDSKQESRIATPDSPRPAAITIGFVGDIFLGRSIRAVARARGPQAPFAAMRQLLEQHDLAVGNLEFSLSDGEFEEVKGRLVVLREDAETLRHSGVGIFSLANNHIMDFGGRGLRATTRFLWEAGMGFFGAGFDLADAERPLVTTCNGRKIAFLGACDASAVYAGPARAGVAPMMSRRLERRVAAARRDADIVVVVIHADLEFQFHPAPFRQRLSRRLIDAGATMVIQHHPHVVQGLETYRGGLIAYSLGNYVFRVMGNKYQESHPGTSDSVLLTATVHFDDDGVRVEANPIPLRIDEDGCPRPCEAEEAERRVRQLERLSEQTLDPAFLRRRRFAACKAELRQSLMNMYYALEQEGGNAALKAGLNLFRRRENWPWMIGFLSGGRY